MRLVILTATLALSTALWAEPKINLRVCVGQPASAYDAASLAFTESLKASGLFQVQEIRSAGAMENLEHMHFENCDVGFTRTDVLQYFNSLTSASNVIGRKTFIPLEDGTSANTKDRDDDLMPYETFREYAQLICNRSTGVSTIKQLKRKANDQIEETRRLKREIARQLDAEAKAEANYSYYGTERYLEPLTAIRESLGDLRSQLSSLERNLITINFVRESGREQASGPVNSNDAVFWETLKKEDSSYVSIPTANIAELPGFSSQEVALKWVMANSNGCFLNIDRVGAGTFLQQLDTDPQYYQRLQAIELNDWDFNDKKVNGIPTYAFVDFSSKQVLMNMRSSSPDAWVFKGRDSVETLAVRSLLVTTDSWYNRVRGNPFAIEAIQKAMLAIKLAPALKDPLVD